MKTPTMKTPIKLQFVYHDLCGWVCGWNNQILILCKNQIRKYIPNTKPFTLILRKTPAEGFTPIKLWVEELNHQVEYNYWKHDQYLPNNGNTFLSTGIDNLLTNLAEGKIKMTLYFKFTQET